MTSRAARVRIRNVRPKAANLRVLENPSIRYARQVSDSLRRQSKSIADSFSDDMSGYVLVAWDKSGGWQSSMSVNRTVMSEGMAIEFARNCLIRRLCEDDTLERLGWDPNLV